MLLWLWLGCANPQALKKQVEAWRNGLADDYAKMKKLAPWVDGQPPCLLAVLAGPVLGSWQRGLLARADAWELIKKEQEAKARLDQKRQKVQRCLQRSAFRVRSMLRLPL